MPIRYTEAVEYSSFDGIDILDFRLVAYTNTDVITNLHDFVTSLEWSESLDSASVTGTVTLFDPEGQLNGIQKGNRIRLSMRSPYGKRTSPFKEINRFIVWSKTRTSANSPYITLTFFDIMVYLMESMDSFLFQKDGAHPKGWTPTQITKYVAKKYQIPLGRIPISKHRIPYLKLDKASLYDVILKVWSLDRKATRKQYIIRAIFDKMWIFPKQNTNTMWSIAEESNLLDSSYTDTLDGMATAITVLGISEETTGNTSAAIKATVVNKAKIAQFGYIHKLVEITGISSKAQALKVARNALLVDLRDNKDATLSCIGIPELRAGDPVAVFDSSTGLFGRFWCSDVRHTLTAGSIITTVGLNWLNIVPSRLPDETELHPADSFNTVPGNSNSKVEAVIIAARTMLGKPYAWGGGTATGTSFGVGHGDTNTNGLDCSGLTLFAFAQVGISLPHHTDAQAALGEPVPLGQEQPGDLVFFKNTGVGQPGTKYGHMGMCTGKGVIIQAVRPIVKEGPASGWALVRRFPQLQTGAGTSSNISVTGTGSGLIGPPAPVFGPTAPSVTYPGDGAGLVALSKWMASRAAAAGLPPELPIMAALVESNIRNLKYGDADSVGFFQMRLSIWSAKYPNYSDNPDQQMQWFIDQAIAVRRRRGYVNGVSARYGEWCADIENPKYEYRGRYQTKYIPARSLLGY